MAERTGWRAYRWACRNRPSFWKAVATAKGYRNVVCPPRTIYPLLWKILILLTIFFPGGSHAENTSHQKMVLAEQLSSAMEANPPITLKLRVGDTGEEVAILNRILARFFPEAQQDNVFGVQTELLVRRFQEERNLDPDGVVGGKTRDLLNLSPADRRASIQKALDILDQVPTRGRFILVNIPSYTLYAYQDGEVVLTSRVIVGKTTRKTPLISSNLYAVKFNPDWTPPPGIIRHDIIPHLRKGDYSWFKKHGVVAISRDGEIIDPSTITLDDYRSNHYRWNQPSGGDNALGVIKFELDNRQNIYLHDTNQRALFSRSQRAFSSGCVRVQEYTELASWALGRPLRAIEDDVRRGKTFTARIPSIPVMIQYSVAFPKGDDVVYFPDIYSMAGQLAME